MIISFLFIIVTVIMPLLLDMTGKVILGFYFNPVICISNCNKIHCWLDY
jgi:hypothetical protein